MPAPAHQNKLLVSLPGPVMPEQPAQRCLFWKAGPATTNNLLAVDNQVNRLEHTFLQLTVY